MSGKRTKQLKKQLVSEIGKDNLTISIFRRYKKDFNIR